MRVVIPSMDLKTICSFVQTCNYDDATTTAQLELTSHGQYDETDIIGCKATNIRKEYYLAAPGAIARLCGILTNFSDGMWFSKLIIYGSSFDLQISLSTIEFTYVDNIEIWLIQKALQCKPHEFIMKKKLF